MHKSIMEEQQMTEQISLKLTFEELEQIDKYIELNDDTRQLFDKIRSAYPKSPVEAAYKRVFGWYPPTTPSVCNYEDNRWSAFQSGYSCGYGDGLENSNEISKKIVDKPEEKQSKTLTDILYRWWDDVFTRRYWDMETSIADLIDQVEQWLPKQTDVCEEYSYETGRNHVLDVIKRKLR